MYILYFHKDARLSRDWYHSWFRSRDLVFISGTTLAFACWRKDFREHFIWMIGVSRIRIRAPSCLPSFSLSSGKEQEGLIMVNYLRLSFLYFLNLENLSSLKCYYQNTEMFIASSCLNQWHRQIFNRTPGEIVSINFKLK